MSQWNDITGVTIRLDTESKGESESAFARNRPSLIVLAGSSVGEMFQLDGTRMILGRDRGAEIRFMDDGVSRQHAAIRRRADDGGRFWLEDMGSRNGTYCNGRRVEAHPLQDGDKIQIGRALVLRFGYQDAYDESFLKLMHDSALRDALTRAFNKRYFTERLLSEFQFARRHREPLSVLLMDLDHFKEINDRHGHVAGDHVLSAFARAVQSSVRNEDVFARYGGEEFTVISRSISLEDSRRMGERLRATIEALDIQYQGYRIPLTVSVGVAAMPPMTATEPVDLLDAADRALYWAKTHGRNQVAVYAPDMKIPDPLAEASPTQPAAAPGKAREAAEAGQVSSKVSGKARVGKPG